LPIETPTLGNLRRQVIEEGKKASDERGSERWGSTAKREEFAGRAVRLLGKRENTRSIERSGSDGLLLRRTYPELEASLIAQFRRDVPRSEYKSYNEAKRVVTWPNGSTTRFGYCRNEGDVYQYQGAEFLFIGLDELTHFTLKQWQFLTSRNRCAVPRSICSMAGATNPGGTSGMRG
jgi:hypothetical protein